MLVGITRVPAAMLESAHTLERCLPAAMLEAAPTRGALLSVKSINDGRPGWEVRALGKFHRQMG
jgi:hypothetical protein